LRLFRHDCPLVLTFALTGLGGVCLDDLTIEVLEPGDHMAMPR